MKRWSYIGGPLFLVLIVTMMVLPVSPLLLDLLLAANFAFAILVLLGTLLLKDSLEFSVFPSLLLVATLSRLALNVSSTRLILLDGYAGKVIETFGSFVIGSSVVVGLVVFLILVVIQFVVITNGAGRVAEVAARFTLDAMPGKQMAIDADLSAGLIDERQARELRKRISKEADFYGAMDGASKFVKGDAIAGIIITTINLLGGLAIGIGSRGLSLAEAGDTYSRLSVGDGLVGQIPALLISMATGLLVTRVGSDDDMGSEIGKQVFGNPRALRLAAVVISAMGLLPGLPIVPFFSLGIILAVIAANRSSQDDVEGQETISPEEEAELTIDPNAPEALIAQMHVEPLELHLAYDILDLIDAGRGGDLLDRIKALRRQIASDLGMVMPPVRTRDDVSLPAWSYRIMLRGVEVGRGEAPPKHVMAIPTNPAESLSALGRETTEPVFGLTAYWIPVENRVAAEAAGATVVDRTSAVITHLAETVRSHAGSLLSRQDVQLLVEGLHEEQPLLANEVGGETLPTHILHSVLRGLLAERVPIRDLETIVESISSLPQDNRQPTAMINAARAALAPTIAARIAPMGILNAVTLEPNLERSFHELL
ncbi:MAG TPA: flagellar type III secretion system protein FlhA, partial [Actinobacteria bacterium]|nr:flagellar type III secretion system protein FlhA [Actinomycetota bacterium]